MGRLRGLTLIEVLIVVMVLAILAAIVTPQLSHAGQDSRLETLRTTLLDVRAQLRLYASQHANQFPSLAEFVTQMTQTTTANGQPATGQTKDGTFGPYLSSVPFNPYTGGKRIGKGAPGTSDWFYSESTGLFRANHDPEFINY